jgi:hypothetical protein
MWKLTRPGKRKANAAADARSFKPRASFIVFYIRMPKSWDRKGLSKPAEWKSGYVLFQSLILAYP